MFRSSYNPANAFFGAPAGTIVIQPVLLLHKREHPGKSFGHPPGLPVKRCIGFLAKSNKDASENSDYHWQGNGHRPHPRKHRYITGRPAGKPFGFTGGFMGIGKLVNGPVQCNTLLYFGGVIKFFFALYKIADHIARQDPGMTKGKICMG